MRLLVVMRLQTVGLSEALPERVKGLAYRGPPHRVLS